MPLLLWRNGLSGPRVVDITVDITLDITVDIAVDITARLARTASWPERRSHTVTRDGAHMPPAVGAGAAAVRQDRPMRRSVTPCMRIGKVPTGMKVATGMVIRRAGSGMAVGAGAPVGAGAAAGSGTVWWLLVGHSRWS